MSWLLRMFLVMTCLVVPLYCFVGWRIHSAVARLSSPPARKRLRVALLLILLFNVYPILVFGAYFTGSSLWVVLLRGGSPVIDTLATYPFWVALIAVAQLFPILLVIDIGWFALARLSKDRMTWNTRHAKLTLVLACSVAVYSAVRVYVDTRTVRVSERILHTSKLEPQAREVRIAHITDMQVDPRTGSSLVTPWVDTVNQFQPDLVLVTGDLVTSGTEYIDQAAAWLGRIKARYGVFACLGDHDIWAGREWITRSLKNNGIEVLDDQNRSVHVGSARFQVTGVTNAYSQRPSLPDLTKLANGNHDDHFSVFLTHQPSESLVEFARRSGYDLFLAGHTHGGQVVISFFGFPLTPVRRESQFLSGFYQVDRMLVSVSNGLGLTFAPVRFQAPAEVTLIRVIGSPAEIKNGPAP